MLRYSFTGLGILLHPLYTVFPRIVSAHLCTMNFGLMYCTHSPKKNSFRGNYMRKYGIPLNWSTLLCYDDSKKISWNPSLVHKIANSTSENFDPIVLDNFLLKFWKQLFFLFLFPFLKVRLSMGKVRTLQILRVLGDRWFWLNCYQIIWKPRFE